MGKHANYLNGMTSWRLAVTLALGQNTVLATLKHAGIPMEPQAPSTEAAATPIDTFDGSSITFTTVERAGRSAPPRRVGVTKLGSSLL
jgi:hypothetical protein